MHEHPSQALLDLRTILARVLEVNAGRGTSKIDAKTLAGVTVVITGDILHSRVARSNALLLPKLGAKVVLCGPKELLPKDALGLDSSGTGGVEIERDFDKALKQAGSKGGGVVMMLRIQRERLAGLELDLADYIARYQLNEERLMACAPHALVMHPGPMIRGLEIQGEVADGPNSAIEDQVRNGLAVRTALLVRALGAGGFESVTV
jgi:aspartate carbamoyltransferase catalytic subunit